MRTRRRVLLAVPLLAASCASGVSMRTMWEDIAEERVMSLSDDSIEQIRMAMPSTAEPLRIGVAPPVIHEHLARRPMSLWSPGHRNVASRRWSEDELELFERWSEELAGRGVIAEIVPLSSVLIDTAKLERKESPFLELRRAAARSHLDAILVIETMSDFGIESSVFSLLDLTIVGAFVIPSHKAEAACVTEAAIIDVRTEYVYAFGRGQGEHGRSTAYAKIEAEEYVAKARLAALEDLAADLTASVLGPAR